MFQYILTFVLQLGNYIPRPDFTGIMQRIRNGFTELGSLWLSQKNCNGCRKLTWKDRLKDRLPVVVIDDLDEIDGKAVLFDGAKNNLLWKGGKYWNMSTLQLKMNWDNYIASCEWSCIKILIEETKELAAIVLIKSEQTKKRCFPAMFPRRG